ncbi:MAG: hypothetical protein KGL75_09760 [Acidobacteriota bacterium]|nr:hypothetical protein [Acidobacteriota bacterium]
MKILKTALLCICSFLFAAVASGVLRARYGCVPSFKSQYASLYESNLARYALLQANQADANDGRAALLQYIGFLQGIRRQDIRFPERRLHYDLGLAYLRLFRLEKAAGDAQLASSHMRIAQQELTSLGWKKEDLSADALEKSIDKRQAAEDELYGSQTPLPNPTEDATPSKANAR